MYIDFFYCDKFSTFASQTAQYRQKKMLSEEYYRRLCSAFGYLPTSEQEHAIGICSSFLSDKSSNTAMILRGCAGTGKTLIASALVHMLDSLGAPTVLLAPTGRAAKVFSQYSGKSAHTIHRYIYRQSKPSVEMTGFELGYNRQRRCLFIVDEASMLSNDYGGEQFGSGRLLDDLVRFVYSGPGCHLMLIGDHAQLPPIGELVSQALQADTLEGYRLTVYEATLTTVMRQSQLSGILWNASAIRQLIGRDASTLMPKVKFQGFADITAVSADDFMEALGESLRRVGNDDLIVITRSNHRAGLLNKGIRRYVFDREDELEGGDMVMTVRNNYYWLQPDGEEHDEGEPTQENDAELRPDFIANGDRAVVKRIRRERELYGFRFADATLLLPDYADMEVEVTLILDTLHATTPSLDTESTNRLYQAVSEDYMHLPTKQERIKAIRQNPYFNALQVKYAYAVTCHKAQGGQWAHVYVDQGVPPQEEGNEGYRHWRYTAVARGREHLYVSNWPEEMTLNEDKE